MQMAEETCTVTCVEAGELGEPPSRSLVRGPGSTPGCDRGRQGKLEERSLSGMGDTELRNGVGPH